MKEQFFTINADNNIKLTATSANYIANMAKELIKDIKKELDTVSFLDKSVEVIGGEKSMINYGHSPVYLDKIMDKLDKIASMNSLIAWLREAIKEKDSLTKTVKNLDLRDYCKLKNIEMPVEPQVQSTLTADDIMDTWPVDKKQAYLYIKACASTYGKYIHEDGELNKALQEVNTAISTPVRVVPSGRDTLIYRYTPTVPLEDFKEKFFELQEKQREYQAQLNSYDHELEDAVQQDELQKQNAFKEAFSKYKTDYMSLGSELNSFKAQQLKVVQSLKIGIPAKLFPAYSLVAQLGKKGTHKKK